MFRGFGKKDKSKTGKSGKGASAQARTDLQAADGEGTTSRAKMGVSQAPPNAADKFEKMTLTTTVSLKDVSAADQPRLFRHHLRLCHQTFENVEDENSKEMEAKKLILLGLVDYVNNPVCRFSEVDYPQVVQMVSLNMFRALPPPSEQPLDEDEEPVMERSWPHRQIVYEFFLRFIVSNNVDPKVAKKYVSHAFILQLLSLFNSENSRERDYLKTILHRIYGKIMALRPYIRKAITNVFLGVIYMGDEHNGIAELLEILGSIINGFALPLKAEHKKFLASALVPLHKVKEIVKFHQQLEYCVTQYVEKDNKMAEPLILGLLRYWPEMNSPKQVLFLHELEEVLDFTQQEEFRKVLVPLFERLAACLDSNHFQVAEHTLILWNNEYLFTMITQNRAKILPIMYDALNRNAKNHWNVTVRTLSLNVLNSFQETDRALFDQVSKLANEDEERRSATLVDRQKQWKLICPQADDLNESMACLALQHPVPEPPPSQT